MSGAAIELASNLRDEGLRTCAFFRKIAPDQWTLAVYDHGAAWNVREVLFHLIHTETEILGIIENIAAGGEGAPANMDMDAYNLAQTPELNAQFAGWTLDALLDSFTTEREKIAVFTEALSDADLARQGRQPLLGIMPLGEILCVVYMHDKMHTRDIRRALDAAKAHVDRA